MTAVITHYSEQCHSELFPTLPSQCWDLTREICWLTSLDEFKNQRIQTYRTFQDNVILLEFGAPFSAWFHTSVA